MFKALTQSKEKYGNTADGWQLSEKYFFSIEEVRAYFNGAVEVKWPIEMIDGLPYVPDEKELKK